MLDFDADDRRRHAYPLKALHFRNSVTLKHRGPAHRPPHYDRPVRDRRRARDQDGFVTGVYCGTDFMLMEALRAGEIGRRPPRDRLSQRSSHRLRCRRVAPRMPVRMLIDPGTGEYLSGDWLLPPAAPRRHPLARHARQPRTHQPDRFRESAAATATPGQAADGAPLRQDRHAGRPRSATAITNAPTLARDTPPRTTTAARGRRCMRQTFQVVQGAIARRSPG